MPIYMSTIISFCEFQNIHPRARKEDLDVESEDAPPKPGNVLDKLVLFSSIDARAKETPSLQRRKSADVIKLSRTYRLRQII